MPIPCPICESPSISTVGPAHGRYQLDCPRCGRYSFSEDTLKDLPGALGKSLEKRAALSHAVRKMVTRTPGALLAWELVERIAAAPEMPSLGDQLGNFVEWVAKAQPSYGRTAVIDLSYLAAVGALDFENLLLVIEYAHDCGYIAEMPEGIGGSFAGLVRLTFRGWAFLDELKKGGVSSRNAFMAMQFGDPALDAVYRDYFKEAVAATGFDLKRLDEGQPAGLIDDRLRVEIRQSRFLIADLSHHNKGAYWEAGYAEGLGKPVIYTCRRDAFEKGAPHFDTNHHLTVIWDPSDLAAAVAKLKDTIRATLPGEAKLAD